MLIGYARVSKTDGSARAGPEGGESTAGDADFTAEPIMIMAGETTGMTMVMAVEDNDPNSGAGSPEMLTVYGMVDGTKTNSVSFYLWDARGLGPAGHRAAPAGGLPGRRRLPALPASVAFGVGVRNSPLPPLPQPPAGRGGFFLRLTRREGRGVKRVFLLSRRASGAPLRARRLRTPGNSSETGPGPPRRNG